jgi:hypothetical protein
MRTVTLDPGENVIDGRWDHVTAELPEGQVLLRLDGVISHLEPKPALRGIPPQATTMAVRMDRAAALGLAAEILDLALTTGWPLPPAIQALIERHAPERS